MKKLFAILFALVMVITLFAGCGNMQLVDTTYTFDRAVISMPDGTVVSGEVQSWLDFENSDQIQVKIDNVSYLVHSSQIVLIAE